MIGCIHVDSSVAGSLHDGVDDFFVKGLLPINRARPCFEDFNCFDQAALAEFFVQQAYESLLGIGNHGFRVSVMPLVTRTVRAATIAVVIGSILLSPFSLSGAGAFCNGCARSYLYCDYVLEKKLVDVIALFFILSDERVFWQYFSTSKRQASCVIRQRVLLWESEGEHA